MKVQIPRATHREIARIVGENPALWSSVDDFVMWAVRNGLIRIRSEDAR